ncbi:hypothetical protein HMI58_05910 [Arthrobacter sp. 147(2020)]|nr:hypothetical protein [Arthrobacter sp. 147(2020)]
MRDRAYGRPDLHQSKPQGADHAVDVPPVDGPGDSGESGNSGGVGDWRSAVGEWARAVETQYRVHPWVLEYRLTAPPATPNELLWLEMLLRVLATTPLNSSEKLSSALMLGNLVRSVTKLEIDVSASDSPEALEEYGSLLFRLLDPEEYREVLGVFSDPTLTVMEAEGAELQFVLERFLDGVAVLIANRS